jgi:3-dehydroquinate synthase
VVVGHGLLARAARTLAAEDLPAPAALVTTNRIWRLHGRRASRLAGAAGPIVMGDGERAKHLQSVERIYHALAARRVDRAGAVIAFGGGVVGDVAGFAAATFLRGLDFVQIPTTLVAQVDSAIGGKVGVNLPAGKNLAGAFHAPALVLVDPSLLRTLPPREFRAGMYEVIKYGVIASRPLFDRVVDSLDAINAQEPRVLTRIILECCRLKADVVQRDEHENGSRRILNFGHTVGHALEAVTGYRRFRHGEAVGWGMAAAARLSAMRGAMTMDEEQELTALQQRLGARPPVDDLRVDDVLDAMSRDKKVRHGRLHFVLCAGIGRTEIVSDVSKAELRAAVRSLGVRS